MVPASQLLSYKLTNRQTFRVQCTLNAVTLAPHIHYMRHQPISITIHILNGVIGTQFKIITHNNNECRCVCILFQIEIIISKNDHNSMKCALCKFPIPYKPVVF